MILKLKSSLLLIIASLLFYACQKEYSLEGNVVGGGTGEFTFTGAPGNCSNPVVTGTYQTGTALGTTNMVTLAVNVTTIGTYTVSTAAVNGISFSAIGNFTATGPQTIVLTGTGTPVAAGVFAYTPGTTGCAFSIIVAGGGGSSTATFTLNGAPGNCTGATTGGTYVTGTALTATNFVKVNVNVTTAGTYTITTTAVNGISFSGTGTFTATGAQVVQLNGTGTPLAAGPFNYTAGVSGCIFSITATASTTPPAVFTYAGGTGTCTSAVPAGTYTTGTALAATNTVTININVSTIGTYSITTPVVNGYSFAGAGSFTTTGAQTVTLTAAGTPLVAGVDNFIPTNGCSFPITVAPGTVVTNFLMCTIDGVATTFNVGLLGERITADTFDITGAQTSATTSPIFGLELVKSPVITTGTYTRYQVTNTSTYCLAGYSDGTSTTVWLTGLLPTTQQFTVIVTSYTTNKITGTFSGTIYSDPVMGTGAKVITLGSFSVSY